MNLNLFNGTLGKFVRGRTRCVICFGSLLLFSTQPVIAQEVPGGCGPLRVEGMFGPIDYRPEKFIPDGTFSSYKQLLSTVEDWHFTREVETLRRPKSSGFIGGDLAYTLRAFPNHHRALMSLMNLSEREKNPQPSGMAYSVDCWFRRAVAWRPDDNMVRMIYATYLAKTDRAAEADQHLKIAASQDRENPFTQNNIGMVYFDMKNYEMALTHAHKAYELGLSTPTLRERLKSVGKWSEPAQAQPVESAKNPQ